MKLKHLLFVLALPLALSTTAFGQIATWTFEASIPTNSGPVVPEVGVGIGSGFHAGAAVYSSPVGNGSAHSYSANTWAVGDYWQFQVSSVGYEDLIVSYDQTSSGTGPGRFNFAYSTDGTTFTDFALNYTVLANASPNPLWNNVTASALYTFNFNLSAIAAIENVPAVYFRVVDASTTSAAGGTVGTAGTDRLDNFTVNASVVPEPQSLALFAAGGMLLLSRFARRRH